MRLLATFAILVALALAGVIGFVVHKHQQRGAAAAGPSTTGGTLATDAKVATLTVADRVDIAAHVPRSGYTVVEFTADF